MNLSSRSFVDKIILATSPENMTEYILVSAVFGLPAIRGKEKKENKFESYIMPPDFTGRVFLQKKQDAWVIHPYRLQENKHIWPFVNIKYAFHIRNKFTTALRRNHPTFYFPRSKFVFFRTFLTVTFEILSKYFNSTILSANRRYPSG